MINVYIVRRTNNAACAELSTGRVFLPRIWVGDVEFKGNMFAHEIGHLLLNPVGVDDSDNPRHLMYHGEIDVQNPPNGLYLSDCIGARSTAIDRYGVFGSQNPSVQPCVIKPRLGNNLAIVATEFAKD